MRMYLSLIWCFTLSAGLQRKTNGAGGIID